MKKASGALGISVAKPEIVPIPNKGRFNAKSVINALENNSQSKNALFFFEKRDADRIYDQVKIHCNTKLCLHSQFFVNWSKRFTKQIKNLSVASNMLVQMITKMGGVPWKVQLPYQINNNGS